MTHLEMKTASVEEIIDSGPDAIDDLMRYLRTKKKTATKGPQPDPTLLEQGRMAIRAKGYDVYWVTQLQLRKEHKPVNTGKKGRKGWKTSAAVENLKNLGSKIADDIG